jgi:hypothetical protein
MYLEKKIISFLLKDLIKKLSKPLGQQANPLRLLKYFYKNKKYIIYSITLPQTTHGNGFHACC